ncbi:MAG: sensor histidine kinase [Deltaproteobacteria bacterium HGW-Deltaproteobacteria-13]|jgi:hypothetical protein|nr:MAG: sensor histidine kinase [Deltaproteobacteria bacterium HGW-Deltaproteobacteria-13]
MPTHGKNIKRLNKGTPFTQFFRRFAILLFVLLINIPSVHAEERIIRVGVYENAPKIFTSESGKPSGIFVDIIEHIAKNEGWKLQYVPGTWVEGLNRVEKGEIDLMPDVAYTADRAKIYSFHKVPALSSWYQVYAPKGNNIRTIFDLNEKRILVLERSVQQAAFARLSKGFGLNITLIPVPDYKTMFEVVSKGKADAAITNHFYGMTHAKEYGLEDTSVVFEPSDLFYAATKNDPKHLLDSIDNHLTVLKKDSGSMYYASLKRWTSEVVPFIMPLWLQIMGIVAGVILLMSLAGSFILKRQVNARTLELQLINQEMEQRIIQRTTELAAAMDKAQAADRLKSAFLAAMSHELRTPLNSIIGFTGMILQGIAGPLNEEQKKQLGMVRGSAHHLLDLINDVLDISKIEAGQLTIMAEPFDLRQSIEKTVQIMLPLARKKNLDLGFRIADRISEVNGDQRRVEQIILNLLSNAVKFTERGEITLDCSADNDWITLSVTDTGIGIGPENIPIIFEAFRQVDSGIARVQEGTGLGLNITKKLVEMMGGSIHVESEFGKGSYFTIKLPIKGKEI